MPLAGEFKEISVDLIRPNDYNPNSLDDDLFNALVEDMESEDIGNLQPILVAENREGGFTIIDGEHRYDAEKLNGARTIPCIVVRGKLAEDMDQQKFQTIRMNKLRGKLNPKKFEELVKDLADRYTIEELAKHLAFQDPSELEAMIDESRRALPPELRKEFDEAKDEIKTIDDLSNVLNDLYTRYGKTLDHHYMVLDFGGKKHLWVRFPKRSDHKVAMGKMKLIEEAGLTADSVLIHLLSGLDKEYLTANRDIFEEAKESG